MNLPVVPVSWCKPIPCAGLEASLIPGRGGVYELLSHGGDDAERLFMGEADDLRQTLLEHISGRSNNDAVRQLVLERDTCFRYWLCDARVKRSQVAAALWDRHAYELGGSWTDHGGCCVRLVEEE